MTRLMNPGPPPKAPDARRRRNVPQGQATGVTTGALQPYKARAVNQKWSTPIKGLYKAIVNSKVPKDATDVEFAWILCDTLHTALTTRSLTSGQISATLVNNCIANLARLGVCSADRARMGVTLKAETPPDEEKAAIMSHYRRILQPTNDAS